MPKRYSPHHYTTSSSLNCWYKAGWIHAFMLFKPNSDPTIWMLQLKSRLITPGSVFLVFLLPNFGKIEWIVTSVSCSKLTRVIPVVVFCCCSPSASRFDVLCVQRWLDGLGCGYLSYYHLSSIVLNRSAHSPLTSDIIKAFLSTYPPLTEYFLFFGPFSINLRDGCLWKPR